MDSLVASYASSSDEEEETFTVKSSKPPSSSSSSSSLFSVIPQPKESRSSEPNPSPFLSSLPPPKSSISRQQNPIPPPNKRVVQIRLPINPRPSNLDDEDDEEEEKARKKRKQIESSQPHDSSVRSFLSAMPAPKSSQALGALPSLGSGSGRRSNLETETPAIVAQSVESGIDQNQSYESEQIAGVENYYGGYETNPSGNSSSSYGGNAWNGGGFEAATSTGLSEAMIAMDSGARRGRRGRKEMPTEIVEVKQDELMKNRPRVDQVKATGIAFGPAYQVCLASSRT